MISRESLQEFKKIYLEQYNILLDDKEALEKATRLLNMMKAVYKPIKKEDYGFN
jgi:hypothetical protein